MAGGVLDGAMSPVSLAFVDEGLERAYTTDDVDRARGWLRVGLWTSIALWIGLGASFVPLAPNVAVPLGIAAGMSLLLAALDRFAARTADHRRLQWIGAFANVAAGLAMQGGLMLQGMLATWGVALAMLIVIFAFLLLGLRFIFAAASVVVYLPVFFLEYALSNSAATTVVGLGTLIPVCGLLGAATYALERGRRRDYFLRRLLEERRQELAEERAKSERLLHNMLPESVAERLKDGAERIAERMEHASVLFADLVGFTDLASRQQPNEVVTMLDQLFSEFDALVEKRQLEKIKTIGDAYMVAAGIPVARDDHATAIVALALDMLESVARQPLAREHHLALRIGIHSGPVVAGVIGRRKLAYDLWGDTVNVASRMESHGVAGAIQLSDATWQLVGERFEAEPRGEIEVKGKGRMRTYLLRAAGTGAESSA